LEIYLDNAATTKPIIDYAVKEHLTNAWYNPSAAYAPAAKVFIEMKKARQLLAEMIGFQSDVIFTSGGTEANNMAVISAFRNNAHYITSATEHPSVYESFRYLQTLGAEVDFVKPQGFCINAKDVAGLVRENTALVSIMHVNNETGALNDIEGICQTVKVRNPATLFHADGVQALFKTKIDLVNSGIDYYSVSAHKIHALKGTGALLVGRNATVSKLHHGGEQEFMLRPGSENTLGIQAFYEALKRGISVFNEAIDKVSALQEKLLDGLSAVSGSIVNIPIKKVPHIVNVSFVGVRAEVLVRVLGEKGIYIGTGAACSRGKTSRVLLESGVERNAAEGAVRISMSSMNTEKEIEIFIEELDKAVGKLRRFGKR
jgi:cysteine desulfurase